jgi:hypothetical protein
MNYSFFLKQGFKNEFSIETHTKLFWVLINKTLLQYTDQTRPEHTTPRNMTNTG